tara:strand:- start:146 stop:655 length:510 start_codon:yes stop_codon:yes gene_type:complete
MTAFDQAWDFVKNPLWTEEGTTADYKPTKRDYERFPMIPSVDDESSAYLSALPRFWESKDKDARGYATFQEGDEPDDPKHPYHQLSLFEIALDKRGKGLMRERLQEMIDELRDHDPEAYTTHVTHSESHTADLWDKLVDEGLIDSASTKPYVTTTPEGRLLPHTDNRSE